MVPTRANETPTFIPEKILGSAVGKRIFQRILAREAWLTRAISSMSGSADFKPKTASIRMGKIAINVATAIFGADPVPSHMINNGAKATLGPALRSEERRAGNEGVSTGNS